MTLTQKEQARIQVLNSLIADHSNYQLVSPVWRINSDTLLRADEDVIQKMLVELGFKRLGSRIRESIGRAFGDDGG